MKRKIILSSAVLIGLLSCNENILEDTIPSKLEESKVSLKSYKYNYKDKELLEISSLLLKEDVVPEGNPMAMRNSEQDESERLRDLKLSYLGLGQEKDSLIVAVQNMQTGSAVILSKDKRIDPILGYVDNYNSTFIPPQMKFYLSSTADALSEEIDEAMKSPEISAKLKNLEGNIDAYFTDLAKQKAEIIRANISKKAVRESRSLDDIMRHENVAYVKGPYLKTKWNQKNSFILKTHSNEIGVEGCVTTAVGQVLNYWGDYVSEINFSNPFGGSYYDKFTKKSFSYPFKNNDLEHKTYEEILFNISEQITTSHGNTGRGSRVIDQEPNKKDLRNFIRDHVKGVKIEDYTGYFNIRRPDEYYVVESIQKGFPAIVSGDGHAWVCDGIVCIRVKRGFIIKWTEHKYYIHMNWGWRGNGDGWFFNNGNDEYKSLRGNKEIFAMLSIAPIKNSSATGGENTGGSGRIFK
ncbi:C10 family peptidase [Ornithobacterium rhinotracheale]|uniref:C10 family peptidase n=1 Tax=Ornithobacterium rhinotracheale TaxID=28251 RepID=UPI0040352B85